MSVPWNSDFVRRIHDAPGQVALCVTGGGSQAVSALLEVPGALRSVLDAAVPYAAAALTAWLGAAPEHYCRESTARRMAMAAYYRAVEYAGPHPDVPLAGIACTASLVSDRPKHGAHRIYAALQTGARTVSHSVELVRGRSRGGEEGIAAALVLNLLAEFKGLSARVGLDLSPPEQPVVARCDVPLEWQELLSGEKSLVAANAGVLSPSATGRNRPANATRRLVFPGAFHPLHDGHRGMAAWASERLGLPVEHELSVVNVDKPPLDFIEMQRRAAQFAVGETLWFSRAATFIEKAALFTHATFVVGVDTIVRIAEPKYYGSDAARDAAMASLAAAGCRFLVFGRNHEGRFQSLGDLRLPETLSRLCDEVPAEAFRLDVSSTSLRASGASA